jgi:fatty-acyl-CoA synthase
VNGWGTPHTITLCGGTHVTLRKFDPVALLALVEKHRVTHLLAVPVIYNALVNHPELSRFDLSSLKFMLTGGAPASSALIRAMEEKLHGEAMVGYGLSETSPVICLAKPRVHLTTREPLEMKQARKAMTGWATPGAQLRVVDSSGKDVPANGQQIGEIVVRSNVVMQGYYREPDATEVVMRDGWFHTGDMAVVDTEGYVLIKDRSKDIIISGGENLSSIEIENTILGHPAVFEAAVVAAPDETWGEVPVGIVVLKPGMNATEEEILDHCSAILAHFKVPKHIHFREQLPKGGTGKILKGELREPFWKGMEKRVH